MFRRAPQGLKPLLNTLRDGMTEVVPSRTHRSPKGVFSKRRPSAATKDLTAEVQDVRKNRSAGVSPAWEAGQHLFASTAPCRLEAGATFSPTTAEKKRRRKILSSPARNSGFILWGLQLKMDFELIPAIDLKGGKCVRLQEGDAARSTEYSDDPVATALFWQEQGATRLHLVDLDGAFSGEARHFDAVRAIFRALEIPVQFGGGVR